MSKINSKRRAENKQYKEKYGNDKKKYLGELRRHKLAKDDAVHESKMARLDWKLAKQKAKLDPAYRQSKAYETARAKKTQDTVRSIAFGRLGNTRYSTDLKKGYAPGLAMGREVTRQVMIGIGVAAVSSLAIKAITSAQ